MANHTTLFYNLMQFIGDSGVRFPDLRLFATFAWAISGLILSESIHLGRWGLYHPGTTKASSKERQLSRWLHNDRIRPMLVYRPMIEKVLQNGQEKPSIWHWIPVNYGIDLSSSVWH